MINVTKTFLPPIVAYQSILNRAWSNHYLTNRGELVLELEEKLKKYLSISNITLTTNGTLPIQIALKAMKLKGEIITTPFSYVATTSSIVWEGCTPVFVDIHPDYLTIDETKIEAAITESTVAILATHVFGNPCKVETIEVIAARYNLKVIYDAAHCFGVRYKEQSLFNYGDVSTCSFHATKLFHTGEGGCWITNDATLNNNLFFYHNFGHDGPGQFFDVGTNAKMSELQAALGLAVLPYVNQLIEDRKTLYKKYVELLSDTSLSFQVIREETIYNYSYFPIIFPSEDELLKAMQRLLENGINTRRYFHPSLNTLEYLPYRQTMPISESISCRILCLPLYSGLGMNNLNKIVNIIKQELS